LGQAQLDDMEIVISLRFAGHGTSLVVLMSLFVGEFYFEARNWPILYVLTY